MASKIAHIIQGKSSPFYKPNVVEYKDKCIVLNARYTYLTGKKLTQKLYRHHTGYPGGQVAIKAKDYLERNPQEMVWRAIKGMTPKNRMRQLYMTKVEIIAEGGHNYQKLGLPQFGKIVPVDYNKVFGITDLTPEKAVITSSSVDESHLPDEFKGFKTEYDETQSKPRYMITPKFTEDNRMLTKFIKYQQLHRRRNYRNIRNKAYRYI
jgi:large subunit ribosomal protein L13